jgi:hypothetical protein
MSQHLVFDPTEFVTNLNREPFRIGHRLSDHPLFELSALRRLCASLPREHIEYNAGDVPLSVTDPGSVQKTGLSPEETIERIAEVPSWLVMKYVEQAPEWGALLDECLQELRPLSESLLPGMGRREAFIFVSSESSVTPFHIDPEVNFLLQIRGDKQMTVFSPKDRRVLSEEQLEAFYTGAHRNLPFPEQYRSAGTRFDLKPGDGVHVPVTAPHWVSVAGGVSVSFSITYRTIESTRRSAVYALNHRMRRAGLSPRTYGQSDLRDNAKYQLMRAARRVRRTIAGAG